VAKVQTHTIRLTPTQAESIPLSWALRALQDSWVVFKRKYNQNSVKTCHKWLVNSLSRRSFSGLHQRTEVLRCQH
jgi:hypothetical protein